MIENKIDNIENKRDQLIKLNLRQLRKEAKKFLVPLYSRKTKAVLVDLILKYQKKALIEEQTNNQEKLSVDFKEIELSVDDDEQKSLVDDDDEQKSLVVDDDEQKSSVDEKCKINAKEFKDIISDDHSTLKKLLSESFPDKKISVTDNKDGSQTILIM